MSSILESQRYCIACRQIRLGATAELLSSENASRYRSEDKEKEFKGADRSEWIRQRILRDKPCESRLSLSLGDKGGVVRVGPGEGMEVPN